MIQHQETNRHWPSAQQIRDLDWLYKKGSEIPPASPSARQIADLSWLYEASEIAQASPKDGDDASEQ